MWVIDSGKVRYHWLYTALPLNPCKRRLINFLDDDDDDYDYMKRHCCRLTWRSLLQSQAVLVYMIAMTVVIVWWSSSGHQVSTFLFSCGYCWADSTQDNVSVLLICTDGRYVLMWSASDNTPYYGVMPSDHCCCNYTLLMIAHSLG